jgi:putative phosphoribosyl transferase
MDDNLLLDGLHDTLPVEIGPQRLIGLLGLGEQPQGLVIFAHGSGSGRLSPRNNYVAERLRRAGLATLLLDLLTPQEERDRRNIFDVALLAQRFAIAHDWAGADPRTRDLSIGYFGASTGAAAALIAAALPESRVSAIVSRGGRPDLAGTTLADVHAPTLLIVGSLDIGVLELNESALARIDAPKELVVVPGAGHLFEEPGALDIVVAHATRWFKEHLRAAIESGSMESRESRAHDRPMASRS